MSHQPPISPGEILVVHKRSRFERDLEEFGIEPAELMSRYRSWDLDAESILRSHERQAAGLARLKELLPEVPAFKRPDLTLGQIRSAKLLIAFKKLIDFFLNQSSDLLVSTFLAYRAGDILDFEKIGLYCRAG